VFYKTNLAVLISVKNQKKIIIMGMIQNGLSLFFFSLH